MGTTSQKLTYLNDTKTKIRDRINAIGGSLDSDDTFRSYADELESLYNEMPKVSASDAESASLSPTQKGAMAITYKGDTQQDSTTGKNKFSTDFKTTDTLTTYTKIDSNSFSFTCSGTWKGATFVVPCKENTDYYFNYTKKVDGTYCYIKGTQTNTDLMAKYYGYFNSFNSGANTTLTITISNGNNSGITSATISNIQLEEGTTTTSFEKYSGGSPSPNPDYPQDIHVVTGDNTIKVEGKNLLNPSSITSNYNYTYNPTTGEFTGTTGKWTNYTLLEFDTPKNLVFSYYGDNAKGLGYKFTYNDDTINSLYPWNETGDYTYVLSKPVKKIESITGTSSNISTFKVMIEENTQATTYEPYKGQSQLISLGDMELCKIGNYQDYIYKTDKWYLKKRIGKVVLDGSETINYTTYGENKRFNIVPTNYTNKIYYSSNTINCISNNFRINWNETIGGRAQVATSPCLFCHSSAIMITMTPDYNVSTSEQMSAFLSTHNTIVYYVLATPQEIEITDTTLLEQLETIKRSYDGVTNISQENNDLPFILDVSALKEWE